MCEGDARHILQHCIGSNVVLDASLWAEHHCAAHQLRIKQDVSAHVCFLGLVGQAASSMSGRISFQFWKPTFLRSCSRHHAVDAHEKVWRFYIVCTNL